MSIDDSKRRHRSGRWFPGASTSPTTAHGEWRPLVFSGLRYRHCQSRRLTPPRPCAPLVREQEKSRQRERDHSSSYTGAVQTQHDVSLSLRKITTAPSKEKWLCWGLEQAPSRATQGAGCHFVHFYTITFREVSDHSGLWTQRLDYTVRRNIRVLDYIVTYMAEPIASG